MMSIKQKLTGKPSIDRPWMQYYPQEMIENLTVPNSTLYEYLMYRRNRQGCTCFKGCWFW